MLGQLATVAWLEIRQMIGGSKLLAIGLLMAGLATLAFVVRISANVGDVPAEIFWPGTFLLMMNFVFLQTTVILIPLALATSLIRNEIDNGTLVYLVTRPIPRPLLLLAKFAAVTGISIVLVVVGMIVFLLAFLLPGGDPTGGSFSWWGRLFDFIKAGVLGVVGYGAIFTLAGLLFKRGLIFGLAYGFISEFVLTNIPAVIREVTIMHYLRSVALTRVDIAELAMDASQEDITDFKDALGLLDLATPGDAALTVLIVSALCLGLSALIMRTREFASHAGED